MRTPVIPDDDKPWKVIIPGSLQLAILGMFWRQPDPTQAISFRRIHTYVNLNYKQSGISTVSTTITRLVMRKWLIRTGHKYTAGISREELIDQVTQAIREA